MPHICYSSTPERGRVSLAKTRSMRPHTLSQRHHSLPHISLCAVEHGAHPLRAHRRRYVRLLLLGESIACLVASVVHARLLATEVETAQGDWGGLVPAGLLFVGVVVSTSYPMWARTAAVMVQTLALVSSILVGVMSLTVGGSAMFAHLLYHLALILLLLWGMTAVKDGPSKPVILQFQWRS